VGATFMLTHPLLQGRSRGNNAVHEDSGVTDGQSGCTYGFWILDSLDGARKWGDVEAGGSRGAGGRGRAQPHGQGSCPPFSVEGRTL